MAENDRVHEPSPVRLLKAREEGLAARSAELSRALTLCILFGSFFVFAGSFTESIGKQIERSIQGVTINFGEYQVPAGFIQLLITLMIFMGALVVGSLLLWHLQSPLSIKFQKTAPDFSRISPGNALGRLFSLSQLSKILFSLVGLGIALALSLVLVWNHSFQLVSVVRLDLNTGLDITKVFFRNTFVATGILILVLGCADYIRERIRLFAQLRMTDEERREEARNNEMSPELRRRMFS